jgi:hypothetical protein
MEPVHYFVTIHAESLEALRTLITSDLDLFGHSATTGAATRVQTTAQASTGQTVAPVSIEGILSLEQVATLVAQGFRVTVEASVRDRQFDPSKILDEQQFFTELGLGRLMKGA